MTKKAPGKSHRKGLTFLEVADMFRDEETAKTWLSEQRWPRGPACIYCESLNVQSNVKHKSMTHRCREIGCDGKTKMFSIKKGTVMEDSNLPYQTWAVGIYLFTTNIKGVSSMKLHRELGISQKAAWFMLHRLRKAFEVEVGPFAGPIEVDETYIGGKRKNMSNTKRKELANTGRGPVGKTTVVGIKDRTTNEVTARVVTHADAVTLQGFVTKNTAKGVKVYTDEAKAYKGLSNHEAVSHSAGEYVRGMAHTNGIESFWSLLKRGYHGTFHNFSEKHTGRYVTEFAGRHNIREKDTTDQMQSVVAGMEGKRLKYKELVA